MSIPGSASSLFFQTAAADAAAAGPIKSLRLNSADTAYLSRTPSSTGNRRTFTVSFWIKKLKNYSAGSFYRIFGQAEATHIYFYGDYIYFDISTTGSAIGRRWTNQVFRDNSAFFHCVCACDTTASTASERMRMYINGSEVTSFSATTDPSQNVETSMNTTNIHTIGYRTSAQGSAGGALDAYLADFYFIDGSALDPTSFGAFDDNGVWQAAAYSGTFGTNGFHLLDFANESTVGHDSSGNNNDWTANNILASITTYSTLGSFSASGSQVGGPLSYAYDSSTGTVGGSTSGITMWGRSGGTATQSGLSIPVTSSVVVYYNVNVSGGSISLNGSSKSAGVPSGGNTTIGTLTWSASDLSNTLTSISISSPNLGVGVYVPAIQVDGSFLTDQSARDLDVLFDVPTNGTQSDTGAGGEVSGNYPTLNPSFGPSTTTLSNGNLEYTNSARNLARSTIATPQSGKWYFEAEVTGETTGGGDHGVGLILASESDLTAGYVGQLSTAYGYYGDGNKYNNGSGSSYGSSFGPGDIIGCAFDADGGNLYFYKNGVAQNSGTAAFTGLTDQYFFAIENGTGGTMAVNFGQRAFAYSAPSGYKTLCTTNFPTPTIPDGSDYFDTLLWTGDGASSTREITGLSMENAPDWIWAKERNGGSSYALFDAVRGFGTNNVLKSNSKDAEAGSNGGYINSTSATSITWAQGSSSAEFYDLSGKTYVAWCWDAGSSTVSNTDGTLTVSQRVNQTAGFSISIYTGNATAGATFGHGLNAVPDMIIIKARDSVADGSWIVGHSGIGLGHGRLLLDDTLNNNGSAGNSVAYDLWNNTAATSSVVSIGSYNAVNDSGDDYVAYCFTAVAGYSAFGSYEGNSSTDGPFIYTGFRVAWLIIKNVTDNGWSWNVYDTTRDSTNANNKLLRPDYAASEISAYAIDFLSNGFKLRWSDGAINQTSKDYVYAAFAENPFQANGGLAR